MGGVAEGRALGTVDISEKPVVERVAVACGRLRVRPETFKLIVGKRLPKGDPETASTIAALNAVKETPRLLPYCHPIPIESVKVRFGYNEESSSVEVCVEVKANAKTGVEMEALVGVSAALLNLWDMVKAFEKDEAGQYPYTAIENVVVKSKVKRG